MPWHDLFESRLTLTWDYNLTKVAVSLIQKSSHSKLQVTVQKQPRSKCRVKGIYRNPYRLAIKRKWKSSSSWVSLILFVGRVVYKLPKTSGRFGCRLKGRPIWSTQTPVFLGGERGGIKGISRIVIENVQLGTGKVLSSCFSRQATDRASLLIIWWCAWRCGIGALTRFAFCILHTTPRAPCLPALNQRLGTRQVFSWVVNGVEGC